ncbi:hypothetical protein APR03_000799 [Promicromonospora thailandica]|uniref:Lipoprotein n=2 Tax=Promicromonospora thailandica TaxID=765201 RepID=A0A9X2G0H5_9MICO|nr:hypothetical protein [Promicromonospora thailandica]BFF19360.1 hypothetical protein GCM10025730_28810 [Promicromonospora thailandica]
MCAMVPSVNLRTRGVTAVTAVVLLLAACSGGGAADDGASAAPSGSATSPEPAGSPADPDAPLDANQACAAMYVDADGQGRTLEERVGAALVGASKELTGTSADEMHALAVELGRLETRVPEEFRAPVEQVRVPFLQLQEGLDLGADQEIELDIASTVEGLKAFEELC